MQYSTFSQFERLYKYRLVFRNGMLSYVLGGDGYK